MLPTAHTVSTIIKMLPTAQTVSTIIKMLPTAHTVSTIIKMLPTAHTISTIHGLHNRRLVNSENVTINKSVRWVKMTKKYIPIVGCNMQLIYLKELTVPDVDQAI